MKYRKTQTAQIKENMVVSYNCENCGELSSYAITLTGTGSFSYTTYDHLDTNPQANMEAALKAQKQSQKAKEKRLKQKNFEHKRCPHCGYLQSWMIESFTGMRTAIIGIPSAILLLVLLSYLSLGIFKWGLELDNYFVATIFWVSVPVIGIIISILWVGGVMGAVNYIFPPNRKFPSVDHTNEPMVRFEPFSEK